MCYIFNKFDSLLRITGVLLSVRRPPFFCFYLAFDSISNGFQFYLAFEHFHLRNTLVSDCAILFFFLRREEVFVQQTFDTE